MTVYRINALLRVAFFLFLLLGIVSPAGAANPLAGKLIQLQGQVSVRRAGAQDWTPGRLDQDLFAGDAAQSDKKSQF